MTSTRRSRSKPHLLKLDSNSGKPCIDFQPDDRWGIKDGHEDEDDGGTRVRRSTRKRKSNSLITTNDKKPAVNGECVIEIDEGEEDDTSHKNASKSAKKDVPANSVSTSRTSQKKKKISPCPSPKDCPSSPKCKNGVDAELNNGDDAKTDDSKDDVPTEVPTDEAASEAKEVEKPSFQDVRKKSDVADVEKEESPTLNSAEDKEKSPVPDSSASKEKSPIICKVSKDTSINENSPSSFRKEDDISIIDEKMPEEADDDNDDIQILNPKPETKKHEDMAVTNEKLCEQSLSNEKTLSKEELLKSAGFPYFNSLKDNVETLIPAAYKPVKFPHSGTLILEENEVIIESPSLLVPLLIKGKDKFPPLEENSKPKASKPKDFFQSAIGQFFINLGASRVGEWYHRDMKRVKQRQLHKNKESSEHKAALAMHNEKYVATKTANTAFRFDLQKCGFCDFRTESRLVMDGHYRIPHITARREYRCNFCNFMSRDFKEMDFHFEALHNKKILSDDQVLFECRYCSFHSNVKSRVNAHLNRCRKFFLPTQNQCPPLDFECPGVTTKPVTINDIINHRKMLMGAKPSFMNPGTGMDNLASMYARKKLASVLSLTNAESIPDSPTLVKHLMGTQGKPVSTGMQLPPGIILSRARARTGLTMASLRPHLQPRNPGMRPNGPRSQFSGTMSNPAAHLVSSGISITPVGPDGSNRMAGGQSGAKGITLTPISSAGHQVVSQKPGPPQPVALFNNVAGNEMSKVRAGMVAPQTSRMPTAQAGRPSRMMPPYQRLNTPPSQVVKNSAGNTFVLCEICDAYIKDLEELRSHMNWVHKVKIHPKMLVSRPPLNCQKCQWRFFTDQGLERHLLGAHGLVTTNMQEMANKNQDGGRCIICGAVFTYKLVSHMTQVHKVTLKPAHLSYKCTVCTATFTLYRLFESHVYNVHSASARRTAEEAPTEAPPAKVVKKEPPSATIVRPEEQQVTKCHECGKTVEDMHKHIIENHMKKCSVKLCRNETCTKCPFSSDEMVFFKLEDNSESDDESDSSDEENDDSKSFKNDQITQVKKESDDSS